MTYTIKEISELLNKSEKTCHRWIEKGLKIIPGGKKVILIKGDELKEFLRNKQRKKKIKLERSQFYCLTCKQAVYAKRGTLKTLSKRKTAHCRVCNGKINRLI